MDNVNIIDFKQTIAELKGIITEEADQAERRKLSKLLSKFEFLQQIEQKSRRTKNDVKKAMSITCYKSIAYCCGLAKDCIIRDGCRQALGVDDETYVEVKERMIWQMLKIQ